jgi:hypothetical protein
MSRSSLLKRPLLAYPGGNPGFDPSHMAAGGTRFSAIATGNGFINLMKGAAGVITNAPAAVIDGRIGPSVKFANSTDAVTFANQSVAIDASCTFGCIFIPNASIGNATLISTSSNASGGFRLSLNSLVPIVTVNGNSGPIMTGTSLVIGVPYFCGFSYSPNVASNATFVLMRLDTGAILTSSPAYGALSSQASSGTYSVGTRVSGNLVSDSTIAAIMYSSALMSKAQLLQWAQDPWSFWYPQKFDLNMMLGASSSSNVFNISAAEGTFTLTGKTTTKGVGLPTTQGSYSLSGEPQTLGVGMPTTQGSYTLTGETQGLGVGIGITQGVYGLTGEAVTLTKTGITAYVLSTLEGLYNLSGKAQDLFFNPSFGGGGWTPKRHSHPGERKEERPLEDHIRRAAAVLSSLGGHARAKALSSKQRSKIAANAAKARWK